MNHNVILFVLEVKKEKQQVRKPDSYLQSEHRIRVEPSASANVRSNQVQNTFQK